MSSNRNPNNYYIPPYKGAKDTDENPADGGEWIQYQSPEGYPYYYNQVTGESKWTLDDTGTTETEQHEHHEQYEQYSHNQDNQVTNNHNYSNNAAYNNSNDGTDYYRDDRNNRDRNNRDHEDASSSSSNDTNSDSDPSSSDSDSENSDDEYENGVESDVESSRSRLLNDSHRSVYNEYALSNRIQGPSSSQNPNGKYAVFDTDMEESFRAYLRTPQGMAAMEAEQKKLQKKFDEKTKPTNNSNSKKYDPKTNKMMNSGNIMITLFAATYSTIESLWASSGTKKKKGKNKVKQDAVSSRPSKQENTKNNKYNNDRKKDLTERRHKNGVNNDSHRNTDNNSNENNENDENNTKITGSSIKPAYKNKKYDIEGNIIRNDSECSLDSLESKDSDDSDVILIKSPLTFLPKIPKWLSYSTLSYSVQHYIFNGEGSNSGNSDAISSGNSDNVGNNNENKDSINGNNSNNYISNSVNQEVNNNRNTDPFLHQRKELWDKVSNTSLIAAQHVGSIALLSLQWLVQTTGTGASIIAGHVWGHVNVALQRYVEDVTANAEVNRNNREIQRLPQVQDTPRDIRDVRNVRDVRDVRDIEGVEGIRDVEQTVGHIEGGAITNNNNENYQNYRNYQKDGIEERKEWHGKDPKDGMTPLGVAGETMRHGNISSELNIDKHGHTGSLIGPDNAADIALDNITLTDAC